MTRIIALLLSVLLMLSQANGEDILLLGVRRSGTQWTTYILQALTNRTIDLGNIETVYAPFKHTVQPELPRIYRKHWKTYGKRVISDNGKNKLILLIRNYREAYLRQYHDRASLALVDLGSQAKNTTEFFDNIHIFESWKDKNRLLIYYEDLMLNPREEITKISRFLNVPEPKLNAFLRNLNKHVLTCFSIKNGRFNFQTPSKGKQNILYHSQKISSDMNFKIDNVIRQYQPDIWEKYLKRYEWTNSEKKTVKQQQ